MALRARDVRLMVKDMGAEPALIKAIEMLCDEMVGHRQCIKDMGDLIMQCAAQVEMMVTIGSNMQTAIDKIKQREEQYNAVQGEPTSD